MVAAAPLHRKGAVSMGSTNNVKKRAMCCACTAALAAACVLMLPACGKGGTALLPDSSAVGGNLAAPAQDPSVLAPDTTADETTAPVTTHEQTSAAPVTTRPPTAAPSKATAAATAAKTTAAPKMTAMPDLYGKQYNFYAYPYLPASSELRFTFTEEPNDEYPDGTICAQAVEPGMLLPSGSTVALTVSLGKPGVSIDYGGEQTVKVGESFTSGFYYALPDNGDPYCMRISSDSPAVRPQTDVMMIGGNNEPRSCMSSHWYYALAVGTATLTVQIGDQIQTCTVHVVE